VAYSRSLILKEVDKISSEIQGIAQKLHAKPELGYKEFYASELLTSILEENGFRVNREVGGLKTAFTASLPSPKKTPVIALIAEYDALPKIGHACGHNMIAAISLGAALALSKTPIAQKGKIVVIGTPAEEGGGGKIKMINGGVFKGIDAAMMAHPSSHTRVIARMLAVVELSFKFKGKSSHAAASPDKGINALDAVIATFNNINALRQQTRDDARIHGIITDGGEAPNIIPDSAEAKFFIRSTDVAYTAELVERVKQCARGGAIATGCLLTIKKGHPSYAPFTPNYKLGEIFRDNLNSLGIQENLTAEREGIGSSDIGNVSQIIPTIHPEFAIGKGAFVNHSPQFAKETVSKPSLGRLIDITKAMALTAAEVIASPNLLKAIKKEFNSR